MANTATSIYFGGSSSYKIVIDGTASGLNLNVGTPYGDNTFEMWLHPDYDSSEASPMIWGMNTDNVQFAWSNSSQHHYWQGSAVANGNTGTNTVPDDTWTHLAWVFLGRTLFVFVNGVLSGQDLFTSDITIENLKLATNPGGSEGNWFRGYMDQIRWSKSARYGNIDIPTALISSSQNAGPGLNPIRPEHVKLLIQSNSTMTTSDSIVDRTGHNSISATSVTVSQGQTNFGNTSFLFGSGDAYLSYTSDGSDHIGINDFSYEQWIHPTSLPAWCPLYIQNGTGNSSTKGILLATTASNTLIGLEYNNNDNGTYKPHATGITTNVWQHVVHARVGNILCAWVNGVMTDTTTTGGTVSFNNPSGTTVQIGHGDGDFTADYDGYMDGIRLCIGQSAYTPHFTPYGGQKNVVHNRGGAVTDARLASANTHAIQMGRAAIGSDVATNANTYCLDFDGTADYLVHHTPQWRSADDRGTIFAWIYKDDNTGSQDILTTSDTATNTHGFLFGVNSSGYLYLQQRVSDTDQVMTATASALSTAQWYSVALTSDGDDYKFYVDGTSVAFTATSGTDDGDWISSVSNRDNVAIASWVRTSAVNLLDGKIMQVAYFGGSVGSLGVLTAAQISALHSAGKSHDLTTATGVYTASEIDDLKGYWRMGNHYLDTADTIYDASGNGYDMHEVSDPVAYTYDTGTTFLNNWQHRGYFTPDKYTSLLIQSSTNEGATSFQDTGPGFKKMEFDGTNDLVKTFPDSADWDLGTGDFCVATWVKIADNSTNYTGILTFCDGTSATAGWGLGFKSTDEIAWWNSLGADTRTVTIPAASYPSNGTWNFIVVSRTDFVTKIYLNGTEMDSQSDRNTYNAAAVSGTGGSQLGAIGRFYPPEAEKYFKGQIAQLGFWKGSGLTASQISTLYALEIGDASWNSSPYSNSNLEAYYTFGNTTSESPADSGTNLYDRSTGSDQDLAVDGATAPFAGHTITATGAIHKTDKSVYGGSSIYFDGSDDYLTTPAGPEWNLPLGTSFTIELWMNCANPTTAWTRVMAQNSGTNVGWALHFDSTSGGIQFGSDTTSIDTTDDLFDTTVITANIWYHVAVSYDADANAMGLYVDGVEANYKSAYNATQPIKNWWTQTVDGEVYIGRRTGSPGYNYQGYMDEIRITSGVARYSKSIERFANTFVAKGDTGDAYTALQIQSNGAKNGDNYSDSINRTGFNTSTATVSGSQVWRNTVGDGFGGANTALYFDGTGFINYGDSTDFEFGTDTDFTFETWINVEKFNSSIGGMIFSKWTDGGGTNREYEFGFDTSGTKFYWNTDGAGDVCNDVGTILPGQWYHLVAQRSGSVLQVYRDGVLKNSAANDTVGGGTSSFLIGSGSSGTLAATYHLIGYIDQFRVSKGIARYGGFQLRTTQQTHVSANSDSGVVTSNSTFGSANNIFSTDGHTVFLLTGDELYSNTHVSASGNMFLTTVGGTNVSNTTTTFLVTVASGMRSDGTTDNIYYMNDFGRAPMTLVRDNHYIFQIDTTVNGSHPFKLSTTVNGTHGGGTEYTTGITSETSGTNTLIKISPTSATPASLNYYCHNHTSMGHTISVVDSTGSDGLIATQPIGVEKGDGTTTAQFPHQRQGISAYGANSYHFDGGDHFRVTQPAFHTNLDFGKKDFTIEYWEYPNVDNGDHIWSLGGNSTTAGRVFEAYYYGNTRFNLVYGLGGTSAPNFNAHLVETNQWAHIAVQGKWDGDDTGRIEIWKNGALQNTSASFTSSLTTFSSMSPGNPRFTVGGLSGGGAFVGYFDSFRISKGIARYGYSGTNTKLGTNAVHHSNCKLLITSNTFSGNTHFDDFSDQGNYWNQQPLSYYGNGTSQYFQSAQDIGTNDAYSIAVWMKWNGGYDSNYASLWDTRYSSGQGLALALRSNSTNSDELFLFGSSLDGTQAVRESSHRMLGYDHGWNLITTTWDYGASPKDIKVYLNANATPTISTTLNSTAFQVSGNVIRFFGSEAGSSANFKGSMGQAGVWEGRVLTTSDIASLWALGPAGNWTTSFSTSLAAYYAVGNHNALAGRPADSASNVYDRSGNGNDGTIAGSMTAPNKGTGIGVTGSVKHSTIRNNFGSSCIEIPSGDDHYLTINGDFDTTGPFTIEWWQSSTYGTHSALWDFRKTDGTTNNNLFFDHAKASNSSQMAYVIGGGPETVFTTPTGAVVDGAWHHVVLQRDATKFKLFWDGLELAHTSGPAVTDHVTDSIAASGSPLLIGENYTTDAGWFGFLDEFAIYHTAKYNPVATGLGTATITPSYLSDPTGNHFTASGLTITDQMLDTPENNFCTWNIIHPTISRSSPAMMAGEGNLQVQGTGAQWNPVFGSMGFTAGKWYYEIKVVTLGTTEPRFQFGWGAHDVISKTAFADGDNDQTGDPTSSLTDYAVMHSWGDQGYCAGGGTTVGYATIKTDGLTSVPLVGDVLMLAADLDNTRFSFGLNGIWYGNINPGDGDSNFSTTNVSGSGTAAVMRPASEVGHYTPFGFLRDAASGTDATPKVIANFGQGDPDGENNYSDSNGRGGFRFEPPQGFLSCSTANMKDADFAPIGPNSAAGTPDKHFDTLIWSGDGTSDRRIGGLNFQPDLIWGKVRDQTYEHAWFDSVRGVAKQIYSSATAAEADVEGVTSFNADGVTIGNNRDFGNESSREYVAWCWKAGNGSTINNDGTLQSTVSANRDAGFSIVTYTGSNPAAVNTVGHGLSQAPEWILVKALETSDSWLAGHSGMGWTKTMYLNTTDDPDTNAAFWNNTDPTSSVFTISTSGKGNDPGKGMVAYCWHGIEGYSKFGTYEGNGNADGPFVYTGFKPAWIMVKNMDVNSRNWQLLDNKRSPINPVNEFIRPNATTVETSNYDVDFLSNGFKVRNTDADYNESGQTFIYMAFAEMPFKYATAR